VTVLAVGVSHRSADVDVLERAAVPSDELDKVLGELLDLDHIAEALVLSTCNRVEVYAVVDAFHGGLSDVLGVLARRTGESSVALHDALYVHYAAGAVEHLFHVTAGLDSMVLGEPQILGQVRSAYQAASDAGTVGRVLHELIQQALRVGKRAHAETGLDAAGASVVSEALEDARRVLGGLDGRGALVVGAGSMGGLAAASLRRAGIGKVVIANRTEERGARLAASLRDRGVSARSAGMAGLTEWIAEADVVVSCTGAMDTVIESARVAEAMRGRADRPLVVCDLGLPRDVAPEVAALPGVTVVDLESLRRRLAATPSGLDTRRATAIVAEEVRAYLAAQRSAEVTPTVTALRRRAAEVVDAELLRLDTRLPGLDEGVRDELARTVRRVVDKLLHTPTVRVKQLASYPAGAGYADALRELFALDPGLPDAVAGTESSPVDGTSSVDGETG